MDTIEPIFLDVKLGAKRLKQAIEDKSLMCYSRRIYPYCEYKADDGKKCAIGVMFSLQDLNIIKDAGCNAESLGGLIEKGLVALSDATYADHLQRLQLYHDRASADSVYALDESNYTDSIAYFETQARALITQLNMEVV